MKFPQAFFKQVAVSISINFTPKNRKTNQLPINWWFQRFFIFTPAWWRWTHFDDHIIYLSNGDHQLEKVRIPMEFPVDFDGSHLQEMDIARDSDIVERAKSKVPFWTEKRNGSGV